MFHAGDFEACPIMIDLDLIRRWDGAGNHYIVFRLKRYKKTGELYWSPQIHSNNLDKVRREFPNAYDDADLPPVKWTVFPYGDLSPLETESEN